MKKTLDQLKTLIEQNNIALLQGAEMSDVGEQTEEYERCHAFKADLTLSKDYLIDSRASNHMVSSRESFTTLTLSERPSINMGYDSQIPVVGIGSIKIQHGEFKNVLYVPSLAKNMLSVNQMTHRGSPY